MSRSSALPTGGKALAIACVLFVALLSSLFLASYWPGCVLFSNDAPLGRLVSQCHHLPERFSGSWQDLNAIGYSEGSAWPNVTFGFQWLFGPVGYAKFYAPACLLLLGLGAWCFFRQLRFSPLVCVLGGLAAMLNSGFFSVACWGLGAHALVVAMSFWALAALVSPAVRSRWLKVIAAGTAVGLGVAEGADVGAIFSVYIAAFALWQAFAQPGPGPRRMAGGLGRIALLAICAGLVAAQSILVLIQTQVEGVAGMQQDTQTKQERWDWATQWSLPKREALNLVIPGLFGYRMDSPEGGNYWGAAGRAAEWDRYFAQGAKGPIPTGFLRFTGGGNYAGLLVVLVAAWAAAQALRRANSIFSLTERRWIYFWVGLAGVSLLLAFGRYAPFYRLLYALPYASTIRNPAKFVHGVNWALVVLFGYGVQGLSRRYLWPESGQEDPSEAPSGSGWERLSGFERKWIWGLILVFVASLAGWVVYVWSRPKLEAYLQSVGFGPPLGAQVASFSFREVGWYLIFFALAIGWMASVLGGGFSGRRARWAGWVLGLLLVADLSRANEPWIVYWNYQLKYASNPVLEMLRDKPYEHRVAMVPPWLPDLFNAPMPLRIAARNWTDAYTIEWAQHLFPYYNIQSLDVVQMARKPADWEAYDKALQFLGDPAAIPIITRRWELTNTRLLLGPADCLDLLNRGIDPAGQRFRLLARFDLVPKPGILRPTKREEITAALVPSGPFALFEFTGALPRAKLYSTWEVETNQAATLGRLTKVTFNPEKTVLVSSVPGVRASTNSVPDPGTVDFTDYSPKVIQLHAKAKVPAVLLLNDRLDPHWSVRVDGQAQPLLRCNYLMRGVSVPAGEHDIEFRFEVGHRGLYVSLAALVVGLVLAGWLVCSPGRLEPEA